MKQTPTPTKRARLHSPLATAVVAIALTAGCDANREDSTQDPAARSQQSAEVTREAAAADEREVVLGTFAPPAVPAGVTPQSRLPADGDLAIYVPNTTLFPGSARLDPAIENPYSGDAEAIAAGERHFAAFNCSGCHAALGGGGMGPPLSDDQWIHGSEPAQIYLTIMHGRSEGMPAFGSMLPRRTVWELVAYIETLNDIDNYATELGFDAEHATSVTLAQRSSGGENETRTRQ